MAGVEARRGILKHHLSCGPEPRIVRSRHGDTVHRDGALPRNEPEKGAHQRGLASTGPSDQRNALPGRHMKRDDVHKPLSGADNHDPLRRKDGRHPGPARSRPRRQRDPSARRKGAAGGAARGGQDRPGRPLLRNRTVVHHRDPIRPPRERKIVGDEDECRPLFRSQRDEKIEDLARSDGVQRTGRLVRDDEARRKRQRDGDRDALALSARELVGVSLGAHSRSSKPGALQKRRSPAPPLPWAGRPVDGERLGDLRANAFHGVQCRCGLLKDHRHTPAAHPFQNALGTRQKVLSLEENATTESHARRRQGDERPPRERFSRSRRPHDREPLASRHAERHAAQERHPAARGGVCRQAVDGEHHGAALAKRGSKRSLSASASVVTASTETTIARPGHTARPGARATRVCASFSIRPHDTAGGWAPSPT